MTERKEKTMVSNFYNGFTLWLTSFFAIPLIISVLFGLFVYKYVSWAQLDYLVLAASILALIPGTIYASSFLNSAYYVKNKTKVIRSASIVAFFFYVLFLSIQIILLNPDIEVSLSLVASTEEFLVSFFGFLAKIATFYLTAKYSLKQD